VESTVTANSRKKTVSMCFVIHDGRNTAQRNKYINKTIAKTVKGMLLFGGIKRNVVSMWQCKKGRSFLAIHFVEKGVRTF
jgi:hypothetical protein